MPGHVAQIAGSALEDRHPGLRFDRRTENGTEVITEWASVPVQAFGTLPDGRPFYFRFRGDDGWLSAWDAGTSDEDGPFGRTPTGEATASAHVFDYTGDPYCGWLDPEQAVDLFETLLAALAPVTDDNPTHRQVMAEQIRAVVEALASDGDSPTT